MASVVQSFNCLGIKTFKSINSSLTGPPSVSIVGLGDKAVKEAKDRLEAAIIHSQIYFSSSKNRF